MHRKTALAIGIALVLWSVQDIAIWQRFFEARQLYQFDPQYQFWHQAFLIALIAIGATWLRGPASLTFAAATWTLANSGLADVLYYWLDLRTIPQTLPWLDSLHPLIAFHPSTDSTVVASALTWIATWLVIGLIGRRFDHRTKEKTAYTQGRAIAASH